MYSLKYTIVNPRVVYFSVLRDYNDILCCRFQDIAIKRLYCRICPWYPGKQTNHSAFFPQSLHPILKHSLSQSPSPLRGFATRSASIFCCHCHFPSWLTLALKCVARDCCSWWRLPCPITCARRSCAYSAGYGDTIALISSNFVVTLVESSRGV